MTTKTRPPASTKIATCYNPTLPVGTPMLIEIRRDRKGPTPFTAARIHRGVGEGYTRHATEAEALTEAAQLGYTDVVRS